MNNQKSNSLGQEHGANRQQNVAKALDISKLFRYNMHILTIEID